MKYLKLFALLAWSAVVCATPDNSPHAALERTPAERRIAAAESALAGLPAGAGSARASVTARLALALAARARETAETTHYARAMDLLAPVLATSPEHFEARRARTWILLGQHEFAAALDAAKALNRAAPDDLLVYAMLVDANVELGNYAEAEQAAQWLLDLRPGSIVALTRAAYLRELFGDLEGSGQLMAQALRSVPATETEQRAWLLTQLAHLALAGGHIDTAADLVEQALEAFPGYHYALGQRGEIAVAHGQSRAAVAAFTARYRTAPHPENLLALGRAQAHAGDAAAASATFVRFEREALAEAPGWDNANRELADYLSEEGGRPAQAAVLMEREAARRRDVHTLAMLAWSRYRAGDCAAAQTPIREALEVGVREASMLFRAAEIEASCGDGAVAAIHYRNAAALAPWHPLARRASNPPPPRG